MGTNENSQKDIQSEIKAIPSPNAATSGLKAKFRRQLKNVLYVTSLVAIGFFFNGCMAGYVASEPGYVQYERPPRPSELSIWIDGDWTWQSQSHQYYQQNGHWDNPRQGQTYKTGYWQSTPKGKIWKKGRWDSDSNQKNNHNQNRN